MRSLFIIAIAAAGLVAAVAPARAQLPITLNSDLYAFPGAHPSPGSAASAALALADRWLADEPFDNPAFSRPPTIALSPMLLHVSRQDLRADNRSYQETSAFFDVAGGYFSLEGRGIGFTLYGHQPVARLEDNSFVAGPLLGPSKSVTSNTDAREFRGGVAVSFGGTRSRFGIAGEWTHRADHYERTEVTGAPSPDTYLTDFSGDGIGGQAGVRVSFGEGRGATTLGASLRYVPEIELTGDELLGGPSGTTTNPISTRREAGWEGGVSGRYLVTDAFHALASVGGKSAQKYEGFGVTSGEGFEWKLAGEYHDQRDPWTLRFGLGEEQQSDVPEPRSGVVGLGFGFQFESTQIDIGVVHRNFKRGDHASSTEDRIVASLVQRF